MDGIQVHSEAGCKESPSGRYPFNLRVRAKITSHFAISTSARLCPHLPAYWRLVADYVNTLTEKPQVGRGVSQGTDGFHRVRMPTCIPPNGRFSKTPHKSLRILKVFDSLSNDSPYIPPRGNRIHEFQTHRPNEVAQRLL